MGCSFGDYSGLRWYVGCNLEVQSQVLVDCVIDSEIQGGWREKWETGLGTSGKLS
jgi:hypothetical protein